MLRWSESSCIRTCLAKNPHEICLALSGTYVDPRIVPGFRYVIRQLCANDRCLFQGRALRLVGVGMGYGKRVTMERDANVIDTNENFFYSDSHSAGYGVKPVALERGDQMTIFDSYSLPIGRARIEQVHTQQEVKSKVSSTGDVIKTLNVCVSVSVEFEGGSNSLSLLAPRTLQLCARVEWVKVKGAKHASVECVLDLQNDLLRQCTLVPRV